jgi:membrane AbrB-like protein
MMQYTRIVMVSISAIVIAALLDQGQVGAVDLGPLGLGWSVPTDYSVLLAGLALALAGYTAARVSGIGSLALFVPAFGGAALQGAGLARFEVPPFIFIPAFAVTGWYIGLMFTRSAIMHCFSLLPIMLAAIALVVFVCGLVSLVLSRMLPDIDLLTAYLAMSPGGIETIIIIARDTNVFLSLILASQFMRLLIVLSIGPSVARAVANWNVRR